MLTFNWPRDAYDVSDKFENYNYIPIYTMMPLNLTGKLFQPYNISINQK